MHSIVLACGDSRRFASHTDRPKQFLKFARGIFPPAQMWENVLMNVQCVRDADLVVALRRDHCEFVEKPAVMERTKVVWLDPTRGQADTLLQVLNQIDLFEDEVLVANCDQGFAGGVVDRMVQQGRRWMLPAALTFRAGPEESSRWSYVNSHPRFWDAEEKNAIGTHALAGAYYFPSRTELAKALMRLLSWERGEPYISQLYGHMPGAKISVEIHRDDWHDWGTPEAFQRNT